MLVEVLLTLVLIVVAWRLWKGDEAYRTLPPGPFAWPAIGSKYVDNAEDARRLRQQYGDIVRTKMGNAEIVLLCNYKLVKEAFQKIEFTDRPHWKSINFLTEGRPRGVILTNGEQWQNSRRFLLRNLRDLGMGKSYLDAAIHQEAVMLVEDFKKHLGTTTIPMSINIAVLNVIWQMVASRRYNLNDPKIHHSMRLMRSMQEDTTHILLSDIFPLVNWLPSFIRRKLVKQDLVDNLKNETIQLFKGIIDEHKASLNPSNLRDVIDEYLIEMNKKTELSSFFNEEDLVRTMFDMFLAGFETTSNMLRWICLYMAAYPTLQRRVQREIDEVVCKGTLISITDKPRLPYLEAVIHEVLRSASLIPFGVSHCTNQEVELGGYKFPENVTFFGCLVLCHEDPHYWSCPGAFNPDRFLDQDGKFVPKKEGFAPFGTELVLVNGRPRHPQSQGSVERSNGDMKAKLMAWMRDNNSSQWSYGIRFVQWTINTSYHEAIKMAPYEALTGNKPRCGLSRKCHLNFLIGLVLVLKKKN